MAWRKRPSGDPGKATRSDRCVEHNDGVRATPTRYVMSVIRMIEAAGLKADVPEFRPGDRVKVHVRVVEGDKSRIQVFEGDVISRRGSAGLRATFTVRKTSGGVGVERIFPIHSPIVEKIEVSRLGKVRRAKLYYLRDRAGKKARIQERRER